MKSLPPRMVPSLVKGIVAYKQEVGKEDVHPCVHLKLVPNKEQFHKTNENTSLKSLGGREGESGDCHQKHQHG